MPETRKGRSHRPLRILSELYAYWQFSIFFSAAEMPCSEKT